MNDTALPPVFVSHGSPMIALEPGAAGAFLKALGPGIDAEFGRPKAILAISAHTTAPAAPTLLAAARHEALYDFGAFDARLNRLRYDAAGAPALARRVASLLAAAQLAVHTLERGGLDHGIWTALRYLYPRADVPVLPLAFVPNQSPKQQFALGAALAPLADEGILILGTGSITHNLRRAFAAERRVPGERNAMPEAGSSADISDISDIPQIPEIPESAAFRAWMHERSAARDWTALADYRRRAPHAVDMHPTDEHLLPWFVAAGAGGRADAPVRLHASVDMGVLGMDVYAFGPQAARLARRFEPADAAEVQR